MTDSKIKYIADYMQSPALQKGGGPPDNGDMEARVAKLESSLSHLETDVKDIKADLRDMKKEAREDFRVLFGALVFAVLGLAGLMAKGFHWL